MGASAEFGFVNQSYSAAAAGVKPKKERGARRVGGLCAGAGCGGPQKDRPGGLAAKSLEQPEVVAGAHPELAREHVSRRPLGQQAPEIR